MRHMDAQNLHTMLMVDEDEKGRQKKWILIWFKEASNAVNWDALDNALANKSQIHKHWLTSPWGSVGLDWGIYGKHPRGSQD